MTRRDGILNFLKTYDGPEVRIMEVCGTHTAQIVKSGIPSLLSPKIHLISGPGCPVCVTVTDYIDRLVALAMDPSNTVYAFGDLLRVRGSRYSLSEAKSLGARVRMVYAPSDILPFAEKNPDTFHIFAAVGFETTVPVYVDLVREAKRRGLSNVKLLTSLKTMPGIVTWLCRENEKATSDKKVTGFLAPGHVCAAAGYRDYEKIAEQFQLPFIVAGFSADLLLAAIYGLVREQGRGIVRNFYPQAVTRDGNPAARAAVEEMFAPCDAAWRGFGTVPGTGLGLRPAYADFDAGSEGLMQDHVSDGCRCADVLMGRISSRECPLFGRTCTPDNPQGACMVSQEGSCFNHFQEGVPF
ncbi:MAG: hydrogenase formation protein HypD [Lachnospiraceae bacterium]|nr:hydrogenase formation protein HypD [Lachnospiraceae bacterium]